MNLNCQDPIILLNDPKCITPKLKPYIDGYNTYINTMNTYCLQSDNIISNPSCNDFVENNIFIQNTDIQKNLKNNISNLCKENLNNN